MTKCMKASYLASHTDNNYRLPRQEIIPAEIRITGVREPLRIGAELLDQHSVFISAYCIDGNPGILIVAVDGAHGKINRKLSLVAGTGQSELGRTLHHPDEPGSSAPACFWIDQPAAQVRLHILKG